MSYLCIKMSKTVFQPHVHLKVCLNVLNTIQTIFSIMMQFYLRRQFIFYSWISTFFSSIVNFNSLKDENKIFLTKHVPEVYFYDSAQSSNFKNNEHLVTFLFIYKTWIFGIHKTRKSKMEFSFKSLDFHNFFKCPKIEEFNFRFLFFF